MRVRFVEGRGDDVFTTTTPGVGGSARENGTQPAQPNAAESALGPLAVGTTLGSYRIVKFIAQGGMGVVYRAEHLRLGRQVALKVLRPELVRHKAIIRHFFEEARAVNQIGHPNIIDIFDFIESYDEMPPAIYMVMELLSGEDLRMRLRSKGPLEAREAVDIAAHVAETLHSVHRAGILHRDLKPENVFLLGAPTGEVELDAEMEERTNVQWEPVRTPGPRIKLLDFGIAAYFGDHRPAKQTEQGRCFGTPAYMAPEQILGLPLDERTDVYALGLVIYEMLAGRPPFSSMNQRELLLQQVQEAPAPISATRGRPVNRALEAIVLRCLQKDPSRRFRDMREVYDALRHGLPLTSEPLASGGSPADDQPALQTLRADVLLRPTEAVAGDAPEADPPDNDTYPVLRSVLRNNDTYPVPRPDPRDSDTYPVPRPDPRDSDTYPVPRFDLHREKTLLVTQRCRPIRRRPAWSAGLGGRNRAVIVATTILAGAGWLALLAAGEQSRGLTAKGAPRVAPNAGLLETGATQPEARPPTLEKTPAHESPPVAGPPAGASIGQAPIGNNRLVQDVIGGRSRPIRTVRLVARPASAPTRSARARQRLATHRRRTARSRHRRFRRDGTIDPFNL